MLFTMLCLACVLESSSTSPIAVAISGGVPASEMGLFDGHSHFTGNASFSTDQTDSGISVRYQSRVTPSSGGNPEDPDERSIQPQGALVSKTANIAFPDRESTTVRRRIRIGSEVSRPEAISATLIVTTNDRRMEARWDGQHWTGDVSLTGDLNSIDGHLIELVDSVTATDVLRTSLKMFVHEQIRCEASSADISLDMSVSID